MGYRSDIKMVCREDDFAVFQDTYLKLSGGEDSWMLEHVSHDTGCAVVSIDDCKWYSGYRCIDAFEDAFRTCFQETDRPAMFCRVGEDYDDIEVRCENDTSLLTVHISPETCIAVY